MNEINLKMKSKILYIIRGLPGSGKSTLSKELVKNGEIHSTDNFFMKNGKYEFDINMLAHYHEENLHNVIRSMEEEISPIVVDNTNITAEYAMPYVGAALVYGYEVIVAETQTSWRFDIEELVKRNVHDCPREVLENMIAVYESDTIFKKRLGLR